MNKYLIILIMTTMTLMACSSCKQEQGPKPLPTSPTVVPTASGTGSQTIPEPINTIDWRPFEAATYQAALDNGLCTLSYFGSCGDQCVNVEEILFKDQKIVNKINELYVAVKVDLPSDPEERELFLEELKEFGVNSDNLPSFLLTFKPGMQGMHISGYMIPESFLSMIIGSEERSQACALAKAE